MSDFRNHLPVVVGMAPSRSIPFLAVFVYRLIAVAGRLPTIILAHQCWSLHHHGIVLQRLGGPFFVFFDLCCQLSVSSVYNFHLNRYSLLNVTSPREVLLWNSYPRLSTNPLIASMLHLLELLTLFAVYFDDLTGTLSAHTVQAWIVKISVSCSLLQFPVLLVLRCLGFCPALQQTTPWIKLSTESDQEFQSTDLFLPGSALLSRWHR